MYIATWIVLGALAGWATGRFLKGNQYGPGVDIIMGIAGALGGESLMQYGFPGRFEIVSATLSALMGAVVLTVLTAFANGRKRYA
jgi:uncharacterized membrane protein YeaQ/YmgE (transglycosylase-associated protein family)